MDEQRIYRLAAEERITIREAVQKILNPWLLSELIVPQDEPTVES